MRREAWTWALRSGAYGVLYYAANAVYQGYMSLYYTDIGLSGAQLGTLGAITALSGMAFAPLWGTLGDRMRRGGTLPGLLAAAAALVLPLALVRRDAAWQFAVAALFALAFYALQPLGDAALLVSLQKRGRAFGPYRLAGAVSFALAGLAYGACTQGSGQTVWVAAALLLLCGGAAFLLPRGGRASARKRGGFARVFAIKPLMCLLALYLPIQLTMGYFNTFYPLYFRALPGGTEALLGVSYLISTLGEVPYLMLSDRIYARFGATIPMCLSGACLTLRWFLLGMGQSIPLVLAAQLLHGGGYIVQSVSLAKFVAGELPGNLQASGQMLLSMVGFGLARAAGNYGGGRIAAAMGVRGGFFLAAGVCLAAPAVYVLLRRRYSK